MALSGDCHSTVTGGCAYRTRAIPSPFGMICRAVEATSRPARAQLSKRHSPVGQNDLVPFLLLIEDDDAIRTALELALSRQGHRVVAAATGEDGLERLRE